MLQSAYQASRFPQNFTSQPDGELTTALEASTRPSKNRQSKTRMITNREMVCRNFKIPKRSREPSPRTVGPRENQALKDRSRREEPRTGRWDRFSNRDNSSERRMSSCRQIRQRSSRWEVRTPEQRSRVTDSRTPTGHTARNAVTPPPPILQAWDLELVS